MEPIPLTAEEFETLPAAVRVDFGVGQKQYRVLPATELAGEERRILTRWSLTAEERKAVAEGADIYLQQLLFTARLQPVLLTAGLPVFCAADATGSSTLEEVETDTRTAAKQSPST